MKREVRNIPFGFVGRPHILLAAILMIVSFSIVIVSAKDFSLGANNSTFIERNYLEDEFVRGKLNISFTNQVNNEFESNFEGGIGLLDLLEEMGYNSSSNFECEPKNCERGFSTISSSGGAEMSVSLGEKRFYGMQITEETLVEEIKQGFEFSVSLDAAESCSSQIYIDLFDDGVIDYYNRNMKSLDVEDGVCSDNAPYGKNFGCFDSSKINGKAEIGKSAYYCQIIKDLPSAPAYRVGANVIKKSEDSDTLKFLLYNYPYTGGQALGSGDVVNPETGEASTIINYSSSEEVDVLVCVWAPSGDGNNYEINVAQASNACGGQLSTQGLRGNFTRAFEIFARPMAFGTLEDFTFNEDSYKSITKKNLTLDLNNYLDAKYAGNCSKGCVIPWSVWGEEDQTVSFNSAKISYKTSDLEQPGDGNLYELLEEEPRVSSKYLLLDISKMRFEVPSTTGSHNFLLRLGEDSVYSSTLSVNIGFEFSVNPRFALVGRETEFDAYTNTNVSSSIWDFGDGSALVYVNGKSAKHLYAQPGTYDLRVTLLKPATGTTAAANSTKKFAVVVGDPKTSANLTLLDLENRISTMKTETSRFSNPWVGDNVKTLLNLTEMERIVQLQRDEFESKARAANTVEADYIPIINSLLVLGIPRSVFISENGKLPGEVGFNNIDVSHLEKISQEDVEDDTAAAGGVINWMSKNYGLEIDFQTISAITDDGPITLLKWYKLTVKPKTGRDTEYAYLIIDRPKSSLILKSGVKVEEVAGGTYIGFEGSAPPSSLELIIIGSDAPEVSGLGAYISPSLRSLDIVDGEIRESWWEDEKGHFNWGRFLIGMALLITSTLFVYIILQAWYKRYYERRLFKNPADLYNLINFVYNSRKSGMKDSLIKEKLKERKWSGEQITYAFNKLEGKRTGMWEIPIFKFVENKKVKKEIEKKQKEKVDRRFIKQSGV